MFDAGAGGRTTRERDECRMRRCTGLDKQPDFFARFADGAMIARILELFLGSAVLGQRGAHKLVVVEGVCHVWLSVCVWRTSRVQAPRSLLRGYSRPGPGLPGLQ